MMLRRFYTKSSTMQVPAHFARVILQDESFPHSAASGEAGPSSGEASGPRQRVIVVDLDLTLVLHDTLHEQLVRLLFRPAMLPGLLRAAFGGKVAVKAYCAEHVVLDAETLRTCGEVLAFLERERANGSHIVLCTAADRRVAETLAASLGIIDEVIATEQDMNMKGAAKARVLAERFPAGFVYAGDHAVDLAVWKKADGIVLVGASAKTSRRARALGKPIIGELRMQAKRPSVLGIWLRALRVHHWSKNVLVFVPIVLAHAWLDFTILSKVLMAFGLLLAITSASYFINDLADLDADRQHASKRHRPIASGQLSLFQAVLFPAITIPLALAAAALLDPLFCAVLFAYLTITLAYSFGLKRMPLLDTFIIAILFTMRLVMGSTFLGQALPVWLVTFSMFIFFSLATAKRHAEIMRARTTGSDNLKSRGYRPDDWPLTLALGVSAGLGSLIILVLYMVDEAFRVVGYTRPAFLWVITLFLAVWIGRIWLLTQRGQMNDDPVTFALRDRVSQAIAIAIAACFVIAL